MFVQTIYNNFQVSDTAYMPEKKKFYHFVSKFSQHELLVKM